MEYNEKYWIISLTHAMWEPSRTPTGSAALVMFPAAMSLLGHLPRSAVVAAGKM